jgi:hypothetical protein
MKGALATLLLVFAGCATTRLSPLQKLPAFEIASQMPGPERPKCFLVTAVDPSAMPSMTPYAWLTATTGESNEYAIRQLWREAQKLKADVVMVSDRGMSNVGSVETYWGFGVTTHETVLRRVLQAICFRVNPGRPGLRCDNSGMVVYVDPEMTDAEIKEGDHLLQIDGAPVSHGPQDAATSSHHVRLLQAEPGRKVKVVWIRPGTGRMESTIAILPNTTTYLSLPDAVAWEKPQEQMVEH